MSTEPSKTRSRLDSLTSLRFIAALLVFWTHVAILTPARDIGWFFRLIQAGPVGVSFFFVLSGFVLTWTRRKTDTPAAFYRRRLARIYPNHAVTWVVSIAVGLMVGRAFGLKGALATLLLVQAWVPFRPIYWAMNPVTWSLSCEAFFYLTFPFLLPVLEGRAAPARRRSLMGVIVAVMLVISTIGHLGLPPQTQLWFTYTFPLARILEFILGILLAFEVRDGRWPRIPLPVAGAVAAAAYLTAIWVPRAYALTVVTVVPFMFVIAAAAHDDLEDKPSILQRRWFIHLGEWSFAFYLLHFFVLAYGRLLLHLASRPPAASLLAAPFLLGLTIVASWVLFTIVERPAERRLRHAPPRRMLVSDTS